MRRWADVVPEVEGGVFDEPAHERHVLDTTPEAIEHARTHARRIAHSADPGT